jgi:Ca2+-binding RTX toxin-like protein
LVLVSVIPAAALRIDGRAGDDYLVGTSEGDVIRAGAGDDVVVAKAGNDTVAGGPGNDVLRSGPGDDEASGGWGDDTVYGGGGRDVVELRWGRDVAVARAGKDSVKCLAPGSCHVRLGRERDEATAYGEVTADLRGGPGPDRLTYRGRTCPQTRACRPEVIMRGARGQDLLGVQTGKITGRVTVVAGPGKDWIWAAGHAQARAGRGNDVVVVWGQANVVDCGPGYDSLWIVDRSFAFNISVPPPPSKVPPNVRCERVDWWHDT